jgi:hypothetical protein
LGRLAESIARRHVWEGTAAKRLAENNSRPSLREGTFPRGARADFPRGYSRPVSKWNRRSLCVVGQAFQPDVSLRSANCLHQSHDNRAGPDSTGVSRPLAMMLNS